MYSEYKSKKYTFWRTFLLAISVESELNLTSVS